jgi:hypothetical protein
MRTYDIRIRFHISNESVKVITKRKDRIIRNPDKIRIPVKVLKQVCE